MDNVVTPDVPPVDLLGWAATARRGDVLEYARGMLAQMRWDRTQLPRDRRNDDTVLNTTCERAADEWMLHEARRVQLTQLRHGAVNYSYLATKL